jgi:hypothetical protein
MEFYSGKYGVDRRKVSSDFGQFDTIAYATGDILTSSAISFANMARSVGFSGKMARVILKETTSGTLQRPSLRLWFFGASVTPASRNSPQAFTTSQIDVLLGTTDVLNANWINCGSGVSMIEKDIEIPYVLSSGSSAIYVVPEVRAAYTFHSTSRIIMQLISEVD